MFPESLGQKHGWALYTARYGNLKGKAKVSRIAICYFHRKTSVIYKKPAVPNDAFNNSVIFSK